MCAIWEIVSYMALAERDTVVRRVITAHATSSRKHRLVAVHQDHTNQQVVCVVLFVAMFKVVRPVWGYTKKVPDKDNDSDTLCSTYLDPL